MIVKPLILVDGLPAGGLERQIVELLRGLKEQSEIETLVCSLSAGGARESEAMEYADSWITISEAANAGLRLLLKFPFLVPRVLIALRGANISLVHTYGCFSDIMGVVISKFFDVPLVNGSIRAARPRLNLRDRVTHFCLPFADTVVANSRAGLQSYGIEKDGIAIHNGVDLERFEGVIPENIMGSPILCMVGNFTDKKDQNSIISCLPELKKEYPDIRLLLIGRGKKLTSVKSYAAQLDCDDQTVFIEGCDVPEPYIAGSDICLLMSNTEVHGEGISNAIIEYMAMGKPVIASDCGGNGELIVANETGILVKDNEPVELSRAISSLLTDPLKSENMGQFARKRIEKEFSLEKMIQAYVVLYKTLAENYEAENR